MMNTYLMSSISLHFDLFHCIEMVIPPLHLWRTLHKNADWLFGPFSKESYAEVRVSLPVRLTNLQNQNIKQFLLMILERV